MREQGDLVSGGNLACSSCGRLCPKFFFFFLRLISVESEQKMSHTTTP
jgi:hypothetical protein